MRERRDMRPRPDLSGRSDAAWPVMVSAVLISGAVAAAVAAATVRFSAPEVPRIAGVRLAEITTTYTTRAATAGETPEGVRAWGEALETALDRVASHHGAVLLPARAVAAGAPDLTPEVEAVLAAILARGRPVASGTPPGDSR